MPLIISANRLRAFLSAIDMSGGEDACWTWLAGRMSTGYGTFSVSNKNHGAHRIAFLYWNGDIPDGMFVCHRCDNRQCVNPKHLFLGTPADNMADKVAKGRQSRKGPIAPMKGEANPRSKLTENDIRAIRARYVSVLQLAEEYGVNKSIIYSIVRGSRWTHVD